MIATFGLVSLQIIISTKPHLAWGFTKDHISNLLIVDVSRYCDTLRAEIHGV